jgi:diguanylate cyclase (GGDEF)-like protein
MVSFKKYLDQEKEDVTSWLVRIVILLLEASALHAVEHDADEHAEFRRQIHETIEKFEQTTESRETLIIAGEAVKALQIYNKSVERFIRNLSAEKQAVIGAMTESFLKLAHTSELSAQSLRALEKKLASAGQLRDVRLLRSKLEDCLGDICQEAARQEERARELKAAENNSAAALAPHDPVTGLPGLQHAEAHIKEIIDAGRPGYVLVLCVKNLDNVNRRVGFAAGDQILTLIGKTVARSLGSQDRLFRWRGPCFATVMERSESHDRVLKEAARIGSITLEKEVDGQGRTLFLKASLAWTLIRLQDVSETNEISKQIDAFVAEQRQSKSPTR